MAAPPISVLLVGADDALASALAAANFAVAMADDARAAREHDAVVFQVSSAAALGALRQREDLKGAALECAVVVAATAGDAALEADLLHLGVQAIVDASDAPAVARALRQAVVRKGLEQAARTAYATDLATGLPHLTQLLEHMTQLLALREREPAPMVLLVLRVQGDAQAASFLGAESANILRRKVAVRLRAGLRAGDVVAAIADDAYAVLLGHVEAQADGERVAAKLVRALQQPFAVAGRPCAVIPSVGLALYPDHGRDAKALLQRAGAQAGLGATLAEVAQAGRVGRGPATAANDETG
jgi:GGDEF domain-containing protein